MGQPPCLFKHNQHTDTNNHCPVRHFYWMAEIIFRVKFKFRSEIRPALGLQGQKMLDILICKRQNFHFIIHNHMLLIYTMFISLVQHYLPLADTQQIDRLFSSTSNLSAVVKRFDFIDVDGISLKPDKIQETINILGLL